MGSTSGATFVIVSGMVYSVNPPSLSATLPLIISVRGPSPRYDAGITADADVWLTTSYVPSPSKSKLYLTPPVGGGWLSRLLGSVTPVNETDAGSPSAMLTGLPTMPSVPVGATLLTAT